MLTLFDYLSSGNGFKVRLLLNQLELPYERIELDIDAGETRTTQYLEVNPNGKIPALRIGDGSVLTESDAILFYLADGTQFLPNDRFLRAQVLQWMFFEQYTHEPSIAVVRYITQHLTQDHPRRETIPELMDKGYAALGVMEQHLAGRDYFAGDSYSIADIALYAYTHVAQEGGFDLSTFPAIIMWLESVRSQPNHIPITHT